ncbi:hypothetical protein [Mycobacterium sp. ACS4331]|uniref:hypothetical protein n=1 Tax=Mycobacterium sp. ACS4331 TaxID=1834121 RepID=UPI0007FDD142|nr:hypothetical protein [Mycobacterium sp. ACS4331]OBF13483.1 hypothetical protein A5727_17110 [Mycobacterium sp. ACS4331]
MSLLAVAALAVAIASWFRPAPAQEESTAAQFSEQEIADATEAVCEAWDTVYRSLITAGYQTSEDPTVSQILALQMKVAFLASGNYLHDALNRHAAADGELARSTEKLATGYEHAILAQLAGAPAGEIEGIKADIREAEDAVKRECE